MLNEKHIYFRGENFNLTKMKTEAIKILQENIKNDIETAISVYFADTHYNNGYKMLYLQYILEIIENYLKEKELKQ